MVAKWALTPLLAQLYITLQYDLGVRRNLNIVGLAFHHFNGFPAQKTGDHHLVQVWWQRQNRRIHRCGIGTDGNRYLHARLLAFFLQAAVMLCALLVSLPVHAGGSFVVDLHAIHAAIALAGFGVLGKHHR